MMRRKLILFVVACALFAPMAGAQNIADLQAAANKGNTEAMVQLARCYEAGIGTAIDSSQALDLYQMAVNHPNNPNPEALARLADYYIRSSFFEPDSAKAFQLCRQAAEKGSAYGYTAMGECYSIGIGVLKSPAMALQCFEKAAANEDPRGLQWLGWCHYWGEMGVERDSVKGISFFTRAADLGDGTACDNMARLYADRGDYKNMQSYLDKGLALNNIRCRIFDAERYITAIGVERNEQEALRKMLQVRQEFGDRERVLDRIAALYIAATDSAVHNPQEALRLINLNIALNNSSRARYMLANSYRYGVFTEVDMEKAFQLYMECANNDYSLPQVDVAEFYLYGYVPSATPKAGIDSAISYLERAYAHSEIAAAEYLGDLYAGGAYGSDDEVLLAPDNAKAEMYYRKAIQWGKTDVLQYLGQLYINAGDRAGGEAAYQEAIAKGCTDGYYWMAESRKGARDISGEMKWLQKGDKADNALCQQRLGHIYFAGYLSKVKPDKKKAAAYYQKSGTDESLYGLSVLYLTGEVGKMSDEDIQKGLKALRTSAYNGYGDAVMLLGACFEEGAFMEVNYDSAASYYSRQAEQGNPVALFRMGYFYANGIGVKQDAEKSVQAYQASADMGNVEAMCSLGELYRAGEFVPQDKKMAFEYYASASVSEQEPQLGCYYVGRSYLEGCGVGIDTAVAVNYLRRASLMGHGKASATLGDLYMNGYGGLEPGYNDSCVFYYMQGSKVDDPHCDLVIGAALVAEGNYENAIDYLMSAAKGGEAKAVYLLGLCEQGGLGIEANEEDGYLLFSMVTTMTTDEEILGSAYLQMAISCLNGTGCLADTLLAKQYFDSAANYGNLRATYIEGLCYLYGLGCEEDSITALHWLEKAAAQEYVYALEKLGDMYYVGEGVPQDFAKAVAYYERAVAAGSIDALIDLGICYENGEGVVLNSQKAFELYSKAAEAGSSAGMFCVAVCYSDGTYVNEDQAKAMEWCLKAAEAGHPVAQFSVGRSYMDASSGKKPNKKKAKEWLQKAAAQGYSPAIEMLGKL